MFDLNGMGVAVLPVLQVQRRVGGAQAVADCGGEEMRPVGVARPVGRALGQPSRRLIGDELFLDVRGLAPAIEIPILAEPRREQHRPERRARCIGDRRSRGGNAHLTIPRPQQVSSLT